MNSEEFIQEIKESYCDPDEILADYREFRRYQWLARQTLDAFVAVCDSANIWYQLAWGSLLGVVRDGGQIPWDYDIDVFVLAKDRAVLVQELCSRLDGEYSFVSLENNEKCRNYIMRIYPKGYDSSALHVDVFFLAGVPLDEDRKTEWLKKMKSISRTRYDKYVDIKHEFAGNLKRQVYLLAMKIVAVFPPVSSLDQSYWELLEEQDLDTAIEWAECDIFAPDTVMEASLLRETIPFRVGSRSYAISKQYDKLLYKMYGDYESYPSFQNRITEMENHLAKLRRLCPISNLPQLMLTKARTE